MGEKALKYQSKTNDIDVSDLGKPDTLRYNILSMVINEEYDRAIRTLKEFVESPGCPKLSPLPSDLAGELQCWLLPAGTVRQECISNSQASDDVKAALP